MFLTNQNNKHSANSADAAGKEKVQTATILDVCRPNPALVMSTLKRRPDLLNAVDDRGNSALLYAARNNRLETAALLLTRGADIHQADPLGFDSLLFATYWGFSEMVELLLEHGADLTHKNACGTCPLSMAVVRGHYDLVEKILDCPLDKCIDDADKSGRTALWLACRDGHVRLVKLLLERGADHSIKSGSGRTPKCIALENKHLDCVKLIEDRESCLIKRCLMRARLAATYSYPTVDAAPAEAPGHQIQAPPAAAVAPAAAAQEEEAAAACRPLPPPLPACSLPASEPMLDASAFVRGRLSRRSPLPQLRFYAFADQSLVRTVSFLSLEVMLEVWTHILSYVGPPLRDADPQHSGAKAKGGGESAQQRQARRLRRR